MNSMSMSEAIRDDNYEGFLEALKDASEHDVHAEILGVLVMMGRVSDRIDYRRYATALLRHPFAHIGSIYAFEHVMGTDVFDAEVFDLALTALHPRTLETVKSIFWQAVRVPNYAALSKVLHILLKDGMMTDDDLFFTLDAYLNSTNAEKNPTRHVGVLRDTGIDVSRYPELLPLSMTTRGIGRELISAGIPKRAAYDARKLNSERYRHALVMELSHIP